MSLIVYQTDHDGYFIAPVEADPDPKTPGNWLIPRGCVGTEPPALAANEAARWVGGAWQTIPDHRGTVYWLADGSRHEITERGITPPVGALDQAPQLPPTVPTTVTMRQARRALYDAGLLDQVNAAVAAFPGAIGDKARIDWEFAQDVKRDDPIVQTLIPSLGLTSQQLDDLFTAAKAIV